MSDYYRPTRLQINLESIRSNYHQLKSLTTHPFFCPMVKSNAYGHGAQSVVHVLKEEGCRSFGVALIEEGEELRQTVLTDDEEILVFGYFDALGAEALLNSHLTPVVNHWPQLMVLEKVLSEKRVCLPIHVQFDTGMSRLGFSFDDVDRVIEFLLSHECFRLDGVCSHLFDAEKLPIPNIESHVQFERFHQVREKFITQFARRIHFHILNSSGLLQSYYHSPDTLKKFGVRPGLSLYGIHPDLESTEILGKDLIDLDPAMSLHSKIVAVNQVKKGETVSYGGIWKAPKDSLVGVVPVGYADGFVRGLSNTGFMGVAGQKVPVVGHVTMDYTVVDLTSTQGKVKEGLLGKDVVIFSADKNFLIQNMAKKLNTISYELMACIGQRVPRSYVG